MRVVTLIGMMGAGKTTVAGVLARRWGWRACDLDELIADEAGLSVSAIFASEGESGFRERERAALDAALRPASPWVLATGGGTPAQPGAMDAIVAAGPSVWLRCTPELLASRAWAQGGRPLLADCTTEAQAVEVLRRLESARRRFYARATVVVDVTRVDTPDSTADRIEAAL